MNRPNRFATVIAGACTAAVLACSGGCPTVRECDIRDAECQRRTADVAACLRGGASPAPPIEVVDAKAFIESEVQEAVSQPASDDLRDLRRGMALFNLVPVRDDLSSTVRDYWNDVAAFFSSKTGKVTILDRGAPLDGPSAVLLLVHELVHAMQHLELGDDYYRANGTTYDRSLALDGVTEGEAVLYQDLATAHGIDRDPDDVDWDDIFRGFEEREWDRARRDDSAFDMASLRFPYAFGGAHVNRAWRAGGSAAVRDAVRHPPISTRQMFSTSRSGTGPWLEDPNEVGVPVMPAEFEFVASRHLGAWLFEIFKDIWSVAPRSFRTFRDGGFTGDVLSVFRTPATSDVTGVWRLRFEKPDQAANLVSNLSEERWLSASQDDRDVVLVASSDDTVPERIIGGLTWVPAAEDDYTEPTNAALGSANVRWACPVTASPF
jgi:hypothetical protein